MYIHTYIRYRVASEEPVSATLRLSYKHQSLANGDVLFHFQCGVTPWGCDFKTPPSPEEIFTDFEQSRTKVNAAGGGGELCVCSALPAAPRLAPPCLQFKGVAVGTVQWRQVALHNSGGLPLRWSAHVRRWPHTRTPALLLGTPLLYSHSM
ncbi:uncharacterized protein LOC123721574 isoform X1 [Papilio machaon]|uniref:uncharacterized protein LOC123721574 isoform X1 n=1 Tax=Papilio machaon TaxID=76193 RepID=UPI001E663E64|nr:uncharacterized protein LOC123721574 isoform X1 [Papilio machaon]